MPPWTQRRQLALAVAAVMLLAAAAAVAVYEHRVGPLPGERLLTRHWYRAAHRGWTEQTAGFFAGVGSLPIAAATVLFGGLAVRRVAGDRAALLVPAAAGAALAALLLKDLSPPTEYWLSLTRAYGAPDSTLPSGHTTYATSMFGTLAVLAVDRGRRDLALAAALVVVGTGPAMVALGAHLPGDVLAGYLLGGGWALGVLALGAWAEAARLRRRRSLS